MPVTLFCIVRVTFPEAATSAALAGFMLVGGTLPIAVNLSGEIAFPFPVGTDKVPSLQ